MIKKHSKLILFFIVLGLTILTSTSTSASSTLHVEKSYVFHNGEYGNNEPHVKYEIPLHHISEYFPSTCFTIEKHRHDLPQQRDTYESLFKKPQFISKEELSPYDFYKSLLSSDDDPYSYVLLDDKLIISKNKEKTCKVTQDCRANKHLFLSNVQEHIRMAGEFRVYAHPTNAELYVILNNWSGTYTPTPEKVHQLLALLQKNKPDPQVTYIATRRDEAIDLGTYGIK